MKNEALSNTLDLFGLLLSVLLILLYVGDSDCSLVTYLQTGAGWASPPLTARADLKDCRQNG